MKLNLWSFISPADPRTTALILACIVAAFFGMRFEALKTMKVKQEFTEYKLAQAELLAKAQQETLNEAVAAQAAIAEVTENANLREKQFANDNDRLRARLADERMRRQASSNKPTSTSITSDTCVSTTGITEGEFLQTHGEDLISLAKDADKVLSGFQDCKAYVNVIRNAYE